MKISDRKIEWHKKAPHYSQAYSSGLEYSFVSDDDKQVHPMVYCKDFLHDAVFATVNETKVSVYGYSYDKKTDIPLPREKTRLALTNSSDPDFGSKIENILDLVRQIEKELRFAPTKVYKLTEPPQQKYQKPGVYLFEGSKQWMSAPPLLSLYTLLLRAGACHKKGTPYMETLKGLADGKITAYQRSDANFLKSGMPGIERILKEKPSKVFGRSLAKNYPKGLSGGTIHNNFGIVAFARNTTKTWCKHWHGEETPVKKAAKVAKTEKVEADPKPKAKKIGAVTKLKLTTALPEEVKTVKKKATKTAVKVPKAKKGDDVILVNTANLPPVSPIVDFSILDSMVIWGNNKMSMETVVNVPQMEV